MRRSLRRFVIKQMRRRPDFLTKQNAPQARLIHKKMCRRQDLLIKKCAAGQIFALSLNEYFVLLIWNVVHFSQITAQNLLLGINE